MCLCVCTLGTTCVWCECVRLCACTWRFPAEGDQGHFLQQVQPLASPAASCWLPHLLLSNRALGGGGGGEELWGPGRPSPSPFLTPKALSPTLTHPSGSYSLVSGAAAWSLGGARALRVRQDMEGEGSASVLPASCQLLPSSGRQRPGLRASMTSAFILLPTPPAHLHILPHTEHTPTLTHTHVHLTHQHTATHGNTATLTVCPCRNRLTSPTDTSTTSHTSPSSDAQ